MCAQSPRHTTDLLSPGACYQRRSKETEARLGCSVQSAHSLDKEELFAPTLTGRHREGCSSAARGEEPGARRAAAGLPGGAPAEELPPAPSPAPRVPAQRPAATPAVQPRAGSRGAEPAALPRFLAPAGRRGKRLGSGLHLLKSRIKSPADGADSPAYPVH